MSTEPLQEEKRLENDDNVAFKKNYAVYHSGLTRTEVVNYYDEWADTGLYDQHLNPDRYKGPEYVARALAKHYPADKRPTVRILDVAAGTGRLGSELYDLGFRNMDALDPSEVMINKAKERNIYTHFFREFIGVETPVPVHDGTYDGLGVSGGFGEGHIPVSALSEIVRIVRSGGMICFVMREEVLDKNSQYNGTLEPFMKKLETNGQWRMVSRERISDYVFGTPGIVFQFIVS